MATEDLTDLSVRNYSAEEGKRREISDSRCRGLVLRITPNGKRTWAFRYTNTAGRDARITIGRYPDIPLKQARVQADKLRIQLAGGTDPRAQKIQRRIDARTKIFSGLAEQYLEQHARRHKAPRSADQDARNLKLHILPKWGHRMYADITRGEAIALVEGLIKRGTPALANRVGALLSKIFVFAIDNDLMTTSPATRISARAPENARMRVLSDAEIRLLWDRLPWTSRTGLALRLMLATGLRAGEVAGLSIHELHNFSDQKNAWIELPGVRTKNKCAHIVPLSPVAHRLIRETRRLFDDVFLFPSRIRAGTPISSVAVTNHMTNFCYELSGNEPAVKTWKADPPTSHDLRRTVRTRLGQLRIPEEVKDAILGHAARSVGRRHYDQWRYAEEKREALDAWANLLQSIVSDGGGSGNVVSLKERTA